MEMKRLHSAHPFDTAGTARCRIPDDLWQHLKLKLNQWVTVIAANESLHCRAWPSPQGTSLQADPFIRRRHSRAELAEWEIQRKRYSQSECDTLCCVIPVTARYVQLERVAIRVIQKNSDEDEQFTDDYDHPEVADIGAHLVEMSNESIVKAAHSALSNCLIGPGCLLGRGVFGRTLEIEILESYPKTSSFGVVNPRTQIELRSTAPKSETLPVAPPEHFERPTTLDDPPASLPGLEDAFRGLLQMILYPLLYPELFKATKVESPRAVLLHGPPGVGKTSLVLAVAKYCKASMVTINGPEVFSPYLGESEEKLRKKFREAWDIIEQPSCPPCILFIDELDAIAPKRTGSESHESRLVAQLLTLMDGMSSKDSPLRSGNRRLVVVAATNRPNAIDPAVRRPGRFDREVAIDVPSEEARHQTLRQLCKSLSLSPDVDLSFEASRTSGYVGADLSAFVREAALSAISFQRDTIEPSDFDSARTKVPASVSKSNSSSVPLASLTWEDIGGNESVKKKLKQTIAMAKSGNRLGIGPARGVLLYGPPGCSKTTLVKVIAATAGFAFFSINGASIYSPYVGDSEFIVRSTFQRARSASPSIVFIDEVDAIIGKRSIGSGSGGDSVHERILSMLLNEMDGIETAKSVLVIGATNRPDLIDAALMRPGRFDQIIYVPPPDTAARHSILSVHTRKMPLSADAHLFSLATRTQNFSGADLESLCREAALDALRELQNLSAVELDRGSLKQNLSSAYVHMRHFENALRIVVPSLSEDMLEQYEEFSKEFGSNAGPQRPYESEIQ
ncbi:P-loop containing nucleoside triphosphate hydrolase protein [Cladochytrium replicatum]|nr:P-loop containing nucleoside triphosphate hydrolase protein [Cladochytrium replicatum]